MSSAAGLSRMVLLPKCRRAIEHKKSRRRVQCQLLVLAIDPDNEFDSAHNCQAQSRMTLLDSSKLEQ